jgi:hypothetical protein
LICAVHLNSTHCTLMFTNLIINWLPVTKFSRPASELEQRLPLYIDVYKLDYKLAPCYKMQLTSIRTFATAPFFPQNWRIHILFIDKLHTLFIHKFVKVLYQCANLDRLIALTLWPSNHCCCLEKSFFLYLPLPSHLQDEKHRQTFETNLWFHMLTNWYTVYPSHSPFLPLQLPTINILAITFSSHWTTACEDGSYRFCSLAFYQETTASGFHYNLYLTDIFSSQFSKHIIGCPILCNFISRSIGALRQ